MSFSNFVEQAREALRSDGLMPREIIFDGEIHRCGTSDKPTGDSGWYVFHDGLSPFGAYGDWRRGLSVSWRAKNDKNSTVGEEATIRRLMVREQKRTMHLRKSERKQRQEEVAVKASRIWSTATPAMSHPYLEAKKVDPFGTRLDRYGNLLVPMVDIHNRLKNLQMITPEGDKRFLSGGGTKGLFCRMDSKGMAEDVIYLCEGWATGASIHQLISRPVVVAFSAGNLHPVAVAIHKADPRLQIVIAGDNDQWTEGNPGVKAANEVARAIGGKVWIPDFTGLDLSSRPTDWNDWVRLMEVARG